VAQKYMNLNKAMIIGNITRDPDVRQTANGATVASFSVATNFFWNDPSGQRQERVEFHNIVAWRKLAEICGQYLHKGSKVYIEGRLQTRDWADKTTGQKRYTTEIVAENMIMLDKLPAAGGAPRNQNFSQPFGNNNNNNQSQYSQPAPQNSEPVINYGEEVSPANFSEDGGFATQSGDDEIKVENIPF
jgi:single-strand DNA-binding protein